NGVEQNISIRVSKKTVLEWNFDPAEDQRPPRNEPVHVIAESNPHQDPTFPVLTERNHSAHWRSSGVVTFTFVRSPCTMDTRTPRRSTKEASSVPVQPAATAFS